nr:hypothetical protein [Mimivirus sp.]
MNDVGKTLSIPVKKPYRNIVSSNSNWNDISCVKYNINTINNKSDLKTMYKNSNKNMVCHMRINHMTLLIIVNQQVLFHIQFIMVNYYFYFKRPKILQEKKMPVGMILVVNKLVLQKPLHK